MDDLKYLLGQRLKSYRMHKGLSQEKLAELADCHPTYIGQLERGEKNATIESIVRLTRALEISLSELFDKLDTQPDTRPVSSHPSQNAGKAMNYPLKCYDLILSKPIGDQEKMYKIIIEIEKYKGDII